MLNVRDLLGMMIESHKRIQPKMQTYALLVECFSKYCVVKEAIRHFRALNNFEGGTRFLHNDGQFGDPLSLYLRALCREGRIVELLEALEAMAKDNQPIPPRAMILSKKYRTLVSSWINLCKRKLNLDMRLITLPGEFSSFGFSICAYTRPTSTSFPFVSGKWNVLYHRVQKARRINLSRGRPLWIPPVEQVEEEVDEEVEELISRIQLQEGNTEFWKRRFLGEDLHNEQKKLISLEFTKGDADESDKAGEE
ncbi:hypothetical protein Droror1_Dr00012867 [Drosera rotundifolia]